MTILYYTVLVQYKRRWPTCPVAHKVREAGVPVRPWHVPHGAVLLLQRRHCLARGPGCTRGLPKEPLVHEGVEKLRKRAAEERAAGKKAAGEGQQ